jgi:hypothetical protein
MVEMMLMQNAQMHQIIMQNMMLKALPHASAPGPRAAPKVGQSEDLRCTQSSPAAPPAPARPGLR